MHKYCTSCGNKVYETFKICPSCGTQSFSSDPQVQAAASSKFRVPASKGSLTASHIPGFVPAGNWARLFAYVIDVVCIVIAVLVVAFVLGISIAWSAPNIDLNSSKALGSLSAWAVLVLYFAIFHSSKLQATPGKLAAGLRIVTVDGQGVGFARAFGRALLTLAVYFLGAVVMALLFWVFTSDQRSPAPFHFALAVLCGFVIWNAPYLMLFFNKDRQTLFDRVCRTRVIKR